VKLQENDAGGVFWKNLSAGARIRICMETVLKKIWTF